MTQDAINFVNMTDTVMTDFDAQKELWEGKVPIVEVITKITGNRTEIAGLAMEQTSAKTTGKTKALLKEMDNMADLTIDIIQRLRPFSRVTDNEDLLSKIDYSKSDLLQSKQTDCINKCKVVYEQGSKYITDAVDYELKQEALDTLESSINGVSMLSGNRDSVIGVRKTATDRIPVLVSRIRNQLTILDDLVPALINDEKFVQTYKNNRRIIDR